MQSSFENLINIDEHPESSLILAAGLYQTGRIFIYPTDTIYGIGGNPFDENVVKRISAIKGRNEKKQFVWLVSDFENLLNYVDVTFNNHLDFLQKIWPGSISVILNLNERAKKINDFDTIAVRIPDNNFCQKLLKEIKQPLISTSVNRSGEEPANEIKLIAKNFLKEVDAIIYNSDLVKHSSSTIIDLTTENPKLIREGSVKFVELLKNFN
ncbi:MAG: L-threonylcarbamoyladenylate synthase [Ignavibacteriaceae bacterium]|jgi:L-threonylcarbamoyladenylate synthase|nr:L-threonylcarbamoyladenylate synthase [Chlorobium sp.]MCW8816513.1 L-threonylcarbamoyladenylate synthase [Ignavibacteriaceae bacterium]MCW8824755.1 L-threonylcarbamoyladenylate synthase [Ignavibacteriaceae bacterium]MCW8960865.1 L-threonylcarbamoyladenylate synthase [Ignavibacteriaceae bacterium]MCW9097283.1 L-threonylcarbamoyladenylate synthase [Ignavibacteriaceae bacterium]